MATHSAVILSLSILLDLATTDDTNTLRVIKGETDIHNKYSYVVVLRKGLKKQSITICTGSLITESWVLTAGHCIADKDLTNHFILFGNLSVPPEKSKSYRKVLYGACSPRYRRRKRTGGETLRLGSDIGLLKIERLEWTRGRVSAVDYKTLVGLSVVYLGGGSTATDLERNDPKYAQNKKHLQKHDAVRPLQYGRAVVVKCDESTTHKFLCLRGPCSEKLQRVQKGDSGGPAVIRGKIVGVLCCHAGVRMYYTAVSPHLDWIHDTITTVSTRTV